MVVQWVPRAQNQLADAASRREDLADFCLLPGAYDAMCDELGVEPVIDLFADYDNTRITRLLSARHSPCSEGVDAFVQLWPDECVYALPPFPMVGRVLARVLLMDRVDMVLVVPLWPSQPWWPLLFPDGIHARGEVRAWHRLRKAEFTAGLCGRPRFLLDDEYSFHALAVHWVHPSRGLSRPYCFNRARFLPCSCYGGGVAFG